MPKSIDCDIHPALASVKELIPFLDPYWREMEESRGTNALYMSSYPPAMPLSAGLGWKTGDPLPGAEVEAVRRQVLDVGGCDAAICNLLSGAAMVANPYYAAALSRAMNDWLAETWLAEDGRFRGSLVVPINNVPAAVEEIERRAGDDRFVQVLLYLGGETPLGRMPFWPIYEAAEKADFTIGIHPGTAYRHAPTPTGWPSFRAEDYANIPPALESQLMSLISEGVFQKFPKLRVVLLESGVTWLPVFMWRYAKLWRGTRRETPWLDRSPDEIIRQQVFASLAPVDAADPARGIEQLCEAAGSDGMWLYASDHPHWQFDDPDPFRGLSSSLREKLATENPCSAYPRIARILNV